MNAGNFFLRSDANLAKAAFVHDDFAGGSYIWYHANYLTKKVLCQIPSNLVIRKTGN